MSTSDQPGRADSRDALARMAAKVEASVGDGTAFFDEVDRRLTDSEWFKVQMLRWAEVAGDSASIGVVVSGAWGHAFAEWVDPDRRARRRGFMVVTPGNLRHEDCPPIPRALYGEFLFLDDSCYKGRTYAKIKARVEEAGGEVVGGLVLYDGSVEPIPEVQGLYRYHLAPTLAT